MSGSPQGSAEASADGVENAAGEWAKTVADGAANAGPPPAAPLGNVTPDAVLDAEPADEDEVVDAEIVDDPEVAEGTTVEEPSDLAEEATTEEGGGDPAADADGASDGEVPDGEVPDVTVEDLVLDLERVTTERDQYLDASRRLQAEFENYKKQVGKREATARERANDSLISELLPVMDAFDGALASGAEDVAPMRTSFLDALAKQGLERIDPVDGEFDPNLHEAVMHEDDPEVDGPVVAEVMRAGYSWKGRVLRPAMVRTKG